VYATIALWDVWLHVSWSVVSSMFPFFCRARSHERDGPRCPEHSAIVGVLITSLFTLAVLAGLPRRYGIASWVTASRWEGRVLTPHFWCSMPPQLGLLARRSAHEL